MKNNRSLIATVSIILYVVASSLAMQQESRLLSAVVAISLSVLLIAFLGYAKLFKEVGFIKFKKEHFKATLYYVPLLIIGLTNLTHGLMRPIDQEQTLYMVITMVLSGLLEEVIFRGFLYNSIAETNPRSALVITSVTFGLGHIVNLLNGAELVSTLLQLAYAIAIGFMLGVMVQKTRNIIPAIVFHSLFNVLSVFVKAEPTIENHVLIAALIIISSSAYGLYMLKKKN